MIISKTPFRITIGGGGTDLPSFYKKEGGFVISLAINKYIYVTLKEDLEGMVKLFYSDREIVEDAIDLKHDRAKYSLLLNNLRSSVEIHSIGDLPSNSGLGSSSTFLVGLLNCIKKYQNKDNSKIILAEEACDIEINRLKLAVGKQDQYIAAYGNIKIFEIEENGSVNVSEPRMSQSDINDFLSNIIVFHVGQSRDASDVLREQSELKGNSLDILKKVKDYGYKTLEILNSKNFDKYGILLDKYWKLKKSLSKKVSIDKVDELYDTLINRFGILGGKIIGAGGGGFLLVYTTKNKNHISRFMEENGCRKLEFSNSQDGTTLISI